MRTTNTSSEPLALSCVPTIMPNGDDSALLRLAHDLSMRPDPEGPSHLLKDRNVALVTADKDCSQNMFYKAAREMGARVSHIRPTLTDDSSPQEVQHTARVLGRLYSALEWPHISPRLMAQLKREGAIPVYGGISLHDSPLCAWAARLDIDATQDDKWRYLIQAMLLRDLG